jgi:hypothetical protein
MKVHRFTTAGTIAIAAAALVIGLTAPAVAHQANIAAHKISGSRLKNNSVTGKQIKESTLATVPNAAKLGGKPASAYARATTATTSGLVEIPLGGASHTVFSRSPVTWIATCTKGSGTSYSFTLTIKATEDLDFTQGPASVSLGTAVLAGHTLEIDNGADTGAIQTTQIYVVTGKDGAQYSGEFTAGINVEGVPCGISITATG